MKCVKKHISTTSSSSVPGFRLRAYGRCFVKYNGEAVDEALYFGGNENCMTDAVYRAAWLSLVPATRELFK